MICMINWIKKIKKFFKKKEKPTVVEWIEEEAEKTLGYLMSLYKEDIKLDDSIGELTINGTVSLPFNKTYIF